LAIIEQSPSIGNIRRNLLPIHPSGPLSLVAERSEIRLIPAEMPYYRRRCGPYQETTMKKLVLAALVVLAGLSGAAAAQSLAYGITLGNVQAVRDSTRNVSTITGFLANQSERNVNSVLLTYVLYDAQNREIGRVSEDVVGPFAPGQIKVVKAITPLEFARVNALDVAAR